MIAQRSTLPSALLWLAGAGIAMAGAGDRGGTSGAAASREINVWPLFVEQHDAAGRLTAWNGAGPFLFSKPVEGGTASGFRPFWVQRNDEQGELRSGAFLYPLFTYTARENTYHWSLFELVRRSGRRASAPPAQSLFERRGDFEVWPLWFSREAGDPEMSYRALFPIAGTVRGKLGSDRLSWLLFPVYVQSERRDVVTTFTPWPIVRRTTGAAHGFGVWPLFNVRERPGIWREEFYLWPLGYNLIRHPHPDDPPGTEPRHDIGALPFYARSTGPGLINESFLWPFFGYTRQTAPTVYQETRYFWPLLVQGRGENRYVNRWGPFYTHSITKGYDKKWYLWPLLRRAEWADDDILLTKTQVLFFLYWSQEQRSRSRPELASAQLTHVWPLFSRWDNGAGRRQWQVFSPLEVFFPANETIRHAWSPLFALARHDQRAPGHTRTSLLWNAVTWEHRAAEERREFHLGPLLSVVSGNESKRVAVGNGLFGIQRPASGGWRMFWWDFAGVNRRPDSK
jgi:hypothetical protein